MLVANVVGTCWERTNEGVMTTSLKIVWIHKKSINGHDWVNRLQRSRNRQDSILHSYSTENFHINVLSVLAWDPYTCMARNRASEGRERWLIIERVEDCLL